MNPRAGKLSPRQVAVFHALSKGLAYKEIAKALGVKVDVVRNDISRGGVKLGARTSYHALALAYETGVIGKPVDAAYAEAIAALGIGGGAT